MNYNRKKTREISVGNVKIGGDNPVSIQSMCSTKSSEVEKTINQINELAGSGCEIVRIAIPDMAAAESIKVIKNRTKVPLIADIHFDYKLAMKSIINGIDGLRLNPGNIGSEANVIKVIDVAKERKIPIRIGVNSGSLSKEKVKKYGVNATSIVESALEHVAILEKNHYEEIKISVKASSVPLTLECYRLLSEKVDYPLHVGVTEAGTDFAGTIKSSIGIGTLLAEGIGDTIRVSLTSNPVNEVKVAREILKSLNLKKGLQFISCPTCGRTQINLINLANEVEKQIKRFENLPITVAVMGCIVNGPGEAREADYGIAGGIGEGLIFKNGVIVEKLPEKDLIPHLLKMIERDYNLK
jgi:(E)-4-hydroxy-3-methylbut-2-enyl-diphosphate synthase